MYQDNTSNHYDIEIQGGRICTKCKEEKEIYDFTKAKKGKYGFDSVCRECKKVIRENKSCN